MRVTTFSAIAILLVACSGSKQIASSNQNSNVNQTSQSAVLWQQTSAEYEALCYQAFNTAKYQLENNLREFSTNGNRMGIIMDLDETVLDNSPYNGMLLLKNENYTSKSWKNWTSKANAKLVPGAKEFIDYAITKDVEIIFISNRSVEELEVTIANLDKLGISINSNNYHLKSETSSKVERREVVFASYDIIMLIGDNLADFNSELDVNLNISERKKVTQKFKSEFGKKFIILPNVMYGNWEKTIKMNQESGVIQDNPTNSIQFINGF